MRFPILEAAIEFVAVVSLAYCLARPAPRLRLTQLPRLVLGLTLALPLVQLLPLPPWIWTAVPGRGFAAQVTAAADLAGAWRPLSLDPEATLASWLALLPPAAMFVATARMATEGRLRLVQLILAFALFGVALGALQLASGTGEGLTPYPSTHMGTAIGLFTNRNHQADFLLIAILFAGTASPLAPGEFRAGRPIIAIRLFVIALLALGVVVTTSRTGTVLLPVALLPSLLLLLRRRIGWKLLCGTGAMLLAAAAVAAQSSVLQRTFARFADLQDARLLYWQDTLWALRGVGPWGTGLGTFIPLYKASETLEAVGRPIVGNAHNDYLQLALEAGVPALAIFLLFIVFLVTSLRGASRRGRSARRRQLAIAAGCAIILLLLHSLVDYPLRMTALSTVFAFCCGLLVPPPAVGGPIVRTADDPEPDAPGARWACSPRGVAAAVGASMVLCVALCAGLSTSELERGDGREAARWAPWSGAALAVSADRLAAAGQWDLARTTARTALRFSPMNEPALRVLGQAAERQGQARRALAFMILAGSLGWRDPATQLWLMDESLRSGETDVALERADASLRQLADPQPVLRYLHAIASEPAVNSALANRLRQQPPWRHVFFTDGRRLPADQWAAHAEILVRLAPAGLTREEIRPFLQRLTDAGRFGDAENLWVRLGGGAPVNDGDFEHSAAAIRGGAGPFEWRAGHVQGTRVTIDRAPNGPSAAVHIRVQESGVGTMLSQMLVLSPGRHLLSYTLYGLDGEEAASAAFGWEVLCLGGDSAVRAPSPIGTVVSSALPNGWSRIEGVLTVPAQGCRAQLLRLRATGTAGQGTSFWIDDVRISDGTGSG